MYYYEMYSNVQFSFIAAIATLPSSGFVIVAVG